MSNKYDAKLFLYQSLLEIPMQVALLETYRQLDEKNFKVYGIMALLNLGGYLASVRIAQAIYDQLHTVSDDPNTSYFVSPFTEHSYNIAFEKYKDNVQSNGTEAGSSLNSYLEKAPAYSKMYMDLAAVSSAARVGYGFISSQSNNPLVALLYGLTQPISVVMDDAGLLK